MNFYKFFNKDKTYLVKESEDKIFEILICRGESLLEKHDRDLMMVIMKLNPKGVSPTFYATRAEFEWFAKQG